MDTTNYDLDGRVYRRVRDGSTVDFVYVEQDKDFPEQIDFTDSRRSFFVISPEITDLPGGGFVINAPEFNLSLELHELTLEAIKERYKDSVRTFTDISAGENLLRRHLLDNSNDYSTDEARTVFSVTFSDAGEALELLMEDSEGRLFFRSNGDWTEVTEEDETPTIFEKKFITIEEEDNTAFVSIWDESQESGDDMFEEDVTPFAAVVQ